MSSKSMGFSFWQKFEITAVIVTGILKFVLMDWLELRFIYIALAVVFWVTYGVYIYRKSPERVNQLGLTYSGFGKSIKLLLPIVIALSASFIVVGEYQQTSVLNWSIIPILCIYPIWGVVQQFIIVGLLAGNLKTLEKPRISTFAITAVTAFIFGIVHFPHVDLVIATTIMAIVYTHLYLKGYNLVVMGILHGWVGAVFFYTMMGRNAWAEVFGKLL